MKQCCMKFSSKLSGVWVFCEGDLNLAWIYTHGDDIDPELLGIS